MGFRRQNDGGCTPCPFSEPGKGDASNPIYQNPPSISDSNCFAKSTDAFLTSLNAVSPGAPGDITAQGCKALADYGYGDDIFYALYYLDKTYCGLGQAHPTGDDPNVNSILTNCSHYGISDLADPGWPSSSYQCTICLSATEQTVHTPSATASASAASVTKLEATSQSSSPSLEVSSSTSPTVSLSSSAKTTTPFPADSTSISDQSISGLPDNRMSTQAIAAIAVCTSFAIAAALILLYCVLRRRRKLLEAYSGGMNSRINRLTSEYIPLGGDTYQPLISHSHSISGERPPLTPPLRLRERKILPSLLRPLSRSESLVVGPPFETVHHSSSSLYSTTQSLGGAKHNALSFPLPPTAADAAGRMSYSFASPPICASTPKKKEPRQERIQAPVHTSTSPEPPSSPPYTRLKSPPPVSLKFAPHASLDDNKTKNNSSSTTTTTTTTASRSPPPPIPAARKGHHRRGTARTPYSSTTTSMSSSSSSSSSAAAAAQDYHNSTTTMASNPGSSSPTRPRRPHDAPLEVPDLVTPLSASPAPTFPPPTKSLPRPPPPPASMAIGIARTTGHSPPSAAAASAASRSLREASISLHSLAEQHRRQRDSWGSWGDDDTGTGTVAGRMFGVAFPPAAGGGPGGAA